jgi:putative transposase
MSRYRRLHLPGSCIFVTVNLARRGTTTLTAHIDILRGAVTATRRQRPFGIDAWIVLPDHFHAVFRLPDGDADISTRIGAIKARFSRDIRRAGFTPPPHRISPQGALAMARNGGVNPALRKGQVGIWQKRFWDHHIRDARDWDNHVAYCWWNPVKHGFVTHPRDWPFSTWHRDMGDLHPP